MRGKSQAPSSPDPLPKAPPSMVEHRHAAQWQEDGHRRRRRTSRCGDYRTDTLVLLDVGTEQRTGRRPLKQIAPRYRSGSESRAPKLAMSTQPGAITAGIPAREAAIPRSGPALARPPHTSSASSVVVMSRQA